jgi:hypothetical protein
LIKPNTVIFVHHEKRCDIHIYVLGTLIELNIYFKKGIVFGQYGPVFAAEYCIRFKEAVGITNFPKQDAPRRHDALENNNIY